MRNVLLTLWHLTPLLPLLQGLWFLSLALALLVALPYIKLKKFEQQMEEIERSPLEDDAKEEELASLRLVHDRWSFFTFISRNNK